MKVLISSLFLSAALSIALPSLSLAHTARQSSPTSKRELHIRNSTGASKTTDDAGYDDIAKLGKRDGTKYVFMHHIVGSESSTPEKEQPANALSDTYDYNYDLWVNDFNQIRAKNIDAVALNVGRDYWEWARVQDAYNAAAAVGIDVFFSFDYTSFDCSVDETVNWVNTFSGSPAQFKVDGRPMVSSFSGDCLGPGGWQAVRDRTGGFLMPFIYNIDYQQLRRGASYGFLDSWQWQTQDDQYYMDILGPGRYAATVSGWFFTHYNYKNFYLRGDAWLFLTRWEELISMRDQLRFVEVLTWNDFGESHYLNSGPPTAGSQPYGTTWTNGYPHDAFFDLINYYIEAFKTGTYPAITKDTIYFWSRPHPAGINANNDGLSRPQGWDWASDTLWVAVFCSSTCSVTLQVGSYSQDFNNLSYGVNKISLPLNAFGSVTVKMRKNGQEVINYTPSDFQYRGWTDQYNFNAYVGSASASGSL
ncbi:glycosyl hydrolase family 71-domain-containing protein [Lentinula edodes]|uniref:Glycosyl hydrolase family 71-domain-containing protein n=1 Tax=Lentinula lateritia TaxID=40482 RepID=A0A9W9B2D1_9AGAR|nr:glycosyl hydrolase family 71-domain-containing protein [Lentinula edodes]